MVPKYFVPRTPPVGFGWGVVDPVKPLPTWVTTSN